MSTRTNPLDMKNWLPMDWTYDIFHKSRADLLKGQACQQLIHQLRDETGQKNLSDGDLLSQFFDIGGTYHQVSSAVMSRMVKWYNAQVVDTHFVACLSSGRLLRAFDPHVHWVTSDILLNLKRR